MGAWYDPDVDVWVDCPAMALTLPDIEAISALLRHAAEELIVPRFRHLQPDDVLQKPSDGDPADIVTVVDRQVEVELGARLTGLLPGVPVLGEEAAHADPSLLTLVDRDDAFWLLDPIDGTKNFASGKDGFGVMLAYVLAGRTRAAWVLMPARNTLYVAEEGSGVVRDGKPVRTSDPRPGLLRGTLHRRYMTPSLAAAVTASAAGRFVDAPELHCAAVEYTDILSGERDFGVFYRLLPWDHAAPALILSEGGGVVEHLSGARYTSRSPDQLTVVARDPDTSAAVRAWFGGVA